MRFTEVGYDRFVLAFMAARATWPQIAQACSAPEELPQDARYWLSEDGLSGYGVTHDATLIAVYSLPRGRGEELVKSAKRSGARHLDCFAGYLTDFYRRHGFVETMRVPNYDPNGPDVVFMTLAEV